MEVSANTTSLAPKSVNTQQYGQEMEYIVYYIQDSLRSLNCNRVYYPSFQSRTFENRYRIIATYYMRIMCDGDNFHQVLNYTASESTEKIRISILSAEIPTDAPSLHIWLVDLTEHKPNNIPQHWQLNQHQQTAQ
jgi:hypothetical protein